MREPRTSPLADATEGWILGSDRFAGAIRDIVSPAHREPDAARVRRQPLTLSLIIEATCEVQGRS